MVDSHQWAMWAQMNTRISDYSVGQTDLTTLVADLRGLFVEADPHDPDLQDDFYLRWSRLDALNELRTEAWAPAGSFREDDLDDELRALRVWLTDLLEQEPGEHG